MAVPAKLPSLAELIRNPKARDQLTDLQLYNFLQELKRQWAGNGNPSGAGDSPADFAARLSRGEWRSADHLRLLSSYLSRLHRREIRFLAVSMPPRHGKSLLIDVWFPVWWLTHDPRSRIILAGYGETFARLWGSQVRDKLIEHSDYTNVLISKDQTAADDWQTTLGGGMVSVGVGGSLVGRGADCVAEGTLVQTSEGPVPIQHLQFAPSSCKILTDAGYEDLQGFRRVEGHGLYRLTTTSGRTLVATGDHRIQTQNGYRPLASLSPGDRLVQLVPSGLRETGLRDLQGQTEGSQGFKTIEDVVALVEPVHSATSVYDIQVGGPRNFFANGILVHNCLIIDDPIKNDQEANSQTYRDRMWNWWQASAFTRLQPNGVVVIVCTRWHEDDLLGRIRREDTAGRWAFLNLPALAEKDDALGRQPGTPLWPEQWKNDDPDYSIRRGSMSPYWWSAQFQGHPVPEGGGVIQRDWFRFYKPTDFPPEPDQWIQSWDPALHDKASSDYWAGQVWARKGANLYLVDSARGHYNLQQASGIIRNWTLKYPKALGKLIESTAMGPAIKQTLQNEIPGIIPYPPKGRGLAALGSKLSRVEAIVPALIAGNIHLPENKDGTKPKWVWELVEECAAFDKGTYDDQVDALTQAVSFLLPGAWRQLRRDEALANQPPSKTPLQERADAFNAYTKRVLQKAERRFFPRRNLRVLW